MLKNKIYIDAGFYRGVTLRRYVNEGIIDKSWTIYVFEPNLDLEVEQRIKKDFKDLPVTLIEKAVWTEDGEVKFHISGREDSASIKGTSGHTDPKEITVPSIDFSKFVAELPEGYIVCSMDIEGSEFYVLEKMLEEHTIDKINLLEIEFHHRLTKEFTPDDARSLIVRIEERGVEVKLKDKLE